MADLVIRSRVGPRFSGCANQTWVVFDGAVAAHISQITEATSTRVHPFESDSAQVASHLVIQLEIGS